MNKDLLSYVCKLIIFILFATCNAFWFVLLLCMIINSLISDNAIIGTTHDQIIIMITIIPLLVSSVIKMFNILKKLNQ